MSDKPIWYPRDALNIRNGRNGAVEEAPRLTQEQETQCRLTKRRCLLTKLTGTEIVTRAGGSVPPHYNATCGHHAFFHEYHINRHPIDRHAHLACPYHGPVSFGNTEPFA